MPKLRSLLSKISSAFKRPKAPALPKRNYVGRPEGYVGIHAGSLTKPKPQFEEDIEEAPFTEAEAAATGEWETFAPGTNEAFLYQKQPILVNSSNVGAAQYLIDQQILIVQYNSGDYYSYENVSEDEAYRFLAEPSKGSFCWDVLRVRGSKTAHRKPYYKVTGFVKA